MAKWHTQVHADFGRDPPDQPLWDHVRQLIGWLNGEDRTEVFIGDVGGAVQRFLVVSGGNDGRYVVLMQDEPRRCCWYLVRPVEDGGPTDLMVKVGGLPDYFPPTRVQDLATAQAVAEHYFKTGRRDKRYRWQRGEPTGR